MAPVEASVPPVIVAAWVAVVGASIGSFLNVVIARLPAGESIAHPRSRCPNCFAPIAWYDNLPVLSWFVLRGRCRACRQPISVRYLVVEAVVAALAVLAWARHGLGAAALAEFVLAALLLALALIDLDTWLLPHALTWPLIAAGLVASAAGRAPAPGLVSSALGAAVGFAAFALVALVGEKVLRKEALGFGDVWLIAGIGAWLGAAALLPVVLLASVQGSLVGLMLIAIGRSQPGPPPAAGPASGGPEPLDGRAVEASGSAPAADPALPSNPAPAGDPAPDLEWIPPRHALPFGPFLAAGALEWLYLSEALARAIPALRAFG
jgi:leader peptidase (prepilin peptidase)/N-methyltransferase